MSPNRLALLSIVEGAAADVEDCMKAPSVIPTKISAADLALCLNRMRQIEAELRSAKLPDLDHRRSGMGRMITDTWPMDFKLGDTLIEAEQAYAAFDTRKE